MARNWKDSHAGENADYGQFARVGETAVDFDEQKFSPKELLKKHGRRG